MEEKKVKIVKFSALTLKKTIKEDKDTATMNWSIKGGYPRISVYTSNDIMVNDKFDYSKLITAPFNYVTFNIFMAYFEKVIKDLEESEYKIECHNTKWENNQRTDKTYLQATVYIGRNSEGVVYLKVTEDKKDEIVFELMPDTTWHKFYDKQKNEIKNKKILSQLYTNAYYKTLDKLMTSEMISDIPNQQVKAIKNTGKSYYKNTETTDTNIKEEDLFPDD